MGVSPTYVPVIRNGVDVSFADVTVTGTLDVAGASTLDGGLTVTGATDLGNTTVDGTLHVTGIATFDVGPVFTQGITVQAPASMNDVFAAAVTATSLGVTGAAGFDCITTRVTADTQPRLALNGNGELAWGPGNAVADTTLTRSGAGALETPGFFAMGSGQSSGGFNIFSGARDALRLGTAGGGLAVAEGANARSGTATLVGGTIAVANTSVSATTRIQITRSTLGGTPGHLSFVRNAGVGFTVTSSSGTDTSAFDYFLVEPA